MNAICRNIREQFNDYLERSVSFEERERFESHLSGCKPCRVALEMTREMLSACQRLEEAPVPVSFMVAWRERLDTAPPVEAESPLDWFRKLHPALRPWPVWGLAGLASIALAVAIYHWTVSVTNTPSNPMVASGPVVDKVSQTPQVASPAPAPLQTVRLDMNQDHLLRIWFDAKQPIEQVRFYLELPDGIVMLDQGQVITAHRLEWTGDLKEGRNLIPVPVRGIAKGQWLVKAWIEKGSTRKETFIELKVG
jgi:hypothetical protein